MTEKFKRGDILRCIREADCDKDRGPQFNKFGVKNQLVVMVADEEYGYSRIYIRFLVPAGAMQIKNPTRMNAAKSRYKKI